ncbi:MAG: fumarylacetoacetate hydrolase family protein [Chloroflexi bacterium]|nr:fumarylacetoacetate hydrolase family protein [Chloroflexota bacterium]
MKLATIRLGGRSRVAIVLGDVVRPLPSPPGGPASMLELIAEPDRWLPILQDGPSVDDMAIADINFEPPLRPTNIIAVGLNYADHAHESNMAIPTEPLVFAKLTGSVIGHGQTIVWDPSLTSEVDIEAELAVVIGRTARNVDRATALGYVFGYTCLNDVSARDLQFQDGQWVRAKSLDTFCPIGPWIVTADEMPDLTVLRVEGVVSGETLQSAVTGDMIFGVAELIARLSRSFTFRPGDIIATGTPPGAGYFREPRRLLRDGDAVTVRIEGIGELSNPVASRAGTQGPSLTT